MRLSTLLVAAPFSAIVAFTASAARADGAFLTINDGSAAIGKRVPLASFTAGTQMNTAGGSTGAGAGRVTYSPATFEIDGADNAAVYFGMALTGKTASTAVVEFTSPDAQGREQVSVVATFSLVAMKSAAVTFDANGFGASYAIEYTKIAYSTPGGSGPAPAAGQDLRGPARVLATTLPSLRRASPRRALPTLLANQASPQVDGVYLTLTSSSPSATLPRTAIKTVALSVDQVLNIGSQSSGAGAGKVTFNPFTITQARASTPQLQQAASRGLSFQTGALTFVHNGPDGKASDVLEIDLRLVTAKDDQVSLVNGATTETSSLAYGGLSLTDAITHAKSP